MLMQVVRAGAVRGALRGGARRCMVVQGVVVHGMTVHGGALWCTVVHGWSGSVFALQAALLCSSNISVCFFRIPHTSTLAHYPSTTVVASGHKIPTKTPKFDFVKTLTRISRFLDLCLF